MNHQKITHIKKRIDSASYDYTIELSEDDECPEWDEFLAAVDQGHYEQTTSWAKLDKLRERRSVRVIVYRDGMIAGGAQLSVQTNQFWGKIVYVRWGPCFKDDDINLRQLWVEGLHSWAKNLVAVYVVVNPCCKRNDVLVSLLKQKGYRVKMEKLPPWNLTVATLIIDLGKSLNEILYDMRRELRREIRIGTESGLEFLESDDKDLSLFFNLMKSTAVRQGQRPNPSNLLFLEQIWKIFQPNGWVRLFIVKKGDKVISTALLFTFGSTARFWKYGWSGQDIKLRPNQFLYWNLIKWSKENGFKYFDIMQVEPEIADTLKNKQILTEKQKKHPLFGPTLFKLGFGGEVFHYPGAYYRFHNTFFSLLFEFVIYPLMKIPPIRNEIRKFM